MNTCECSPCTTIARLQSAVHAQTGEKLSQSTVRRALKEVGLSRRRLPSRSLGTPTAEQVAAFRAEFARHAPAGTLVVSVDECHFSERVLPQYGYCKRGHHAIRRRTGCGGWTSYSLMHAIASDGSVHSSLVKGSVSRQMFADYVLTMPFPAGAVLMLDNCSIHKRIEDQLQKKGYRAVFLSPYSPQFQPVELAFSVIKNRFRQGWPWEQGVTDAVWAAINSVSPANNMAFIKHALGVIQGACE